MAENKKDSDRNYLVKSKDQLSAIHNIQNSQLALLGNIIYKQKQLICNGIKKRFEVSEIRSYPKTGSICLKSMKITKSAGGSDSCEDR